MIQKSTKIRNTPTHNTVTLFLILRMILRSLSKFIVEEKKINFMILNNNFMKKQKEKKRKKNKKKNH